MSIKVFSHHEITAQKQPVCDHLPNHLYPTKWTNL